MLDELIKKKMVKGVEKLDMKCNIEIVSLKMCFNRVHALYGTQMHRLCVPQIWSCLREKTAPMLFKVITGNR